MAQAGRVVEVGRSIDGTTILRICSCVLSSTGLVAEAAGGKHYADVMEARISNQLR